MRLETNKGRGCLEEVNLKLHDRFENSFTDIKLSILFQVDNRRIIFITITKVSREKPVRKYSF